MTTSPTFVAEFENGDSVVVTRMTVRMPGGRLNMVRGVHLARAAYEFANKEASAGDRFRALRVRWRDHRDLHPRAPGCRAMTGGRASREKGNRTERAIVRLLQERGLAAERVPLSGAARGRFGGDVSVPVLGVDRRVEVKCRGNGFRELYKWLGGADMLIVRADRRELLVVVPLKLGVEIAAMAERAKRSAP